MGAREWSICLQEVERNELSILSEIQYVYVMDFHSTRNDRVRGSETNRAPCVACAIIRFIVYIDKSWPPEVLNT